MNTLKLPLVNRKFSDRFSKDALASAKKIKQNYGSIISEASATVGVDIPIIIGFMIIENTPANPNLVSPCSATAKADLRCSYGLMQMQVDTAFDTMKRQAAQGLKAKEAAIIQKYLPGFLKPAGTVGFLRAWRLKIYQALLKPEFNIWMGVIHLGQLMKDTEKQFGTYRLDHVIIKYNRGIGNYNKEVKKAGLEKVDTATLAEKLPVAETRAYIVKFVGIEGSIWAAMKA